MQNAKSSLRLFARFLRLGTSLVLGGAGAWLLWHGGSEGLKLLHDFGQTQGDASVMALGFAMVIYLPMVALGTLCLGMAWRTHRPPAAADPADSTFS